MKPETKPKILVVGDVMLDNYYIGTTTRISPEAPIPVVKVTEVKTFEGGAANVRMNLDALGAETRMVSGGPYEPCTVKNRLIVGTTQLARWDENDEVKPIELEALDKAMLHWTPDAIIVSDYGKGSVDDTIIEWISDHQHIPIFIDTKRNPNDFPYFDQNFFPNEKEFEQYPEEYCSRSRVFLKCGAQGIQQLRFGKPVAEFPAYARNVVSVCGAGDTILAAYTYFTTLGDPAALFKASIAAAIVVEKPWKRF
jgi:D-beta-D-heptose 7-phosphate kinase/D-beta-D-heptose 1-phosphate adenosyltransferase